ncbi:MAG: hypothetical protein F6J90_10495 [Moorea sp. SIOASIH]|nr:hypothetical protein [Moorena sp. SIOASIH]
MWEVWEVWEVWGDGEMGRFVLRVIISTSYYSLKGNPGKQGIPVIESG